MVEAIVGWLKLLRGVIFFSFSCRLRFSFFLKAGGGGGMLIFFQTLKVSHGIKIFPVT